MLYVIVLIWMEKLAEAENESKKPASTCREHGDSLLWLCNVCTEPICSTCLVDGKHQGHATVDLVDAWKNAKQSVTTQLPAMEQDTHIMTTEIEYHLTETEYHFQYRRQHDPRRRRWIACGGDGTIESSARRCG